MRILVVEDEPEMARLIVNQVGRSGFIADHVSSLDYALEAMSLHSYSVALLDRRLPDGDGVSLLPIIRQMQPGVRILMLTAMDDVDEKIAGLDAGADDYLTKPFYIAELMSRIRASLRRPGWEAAPPILVGELSFDLFARVVSVAGQPVVFHRRELALLEALVRRVGRVAPRETLLEEIYGFDDDHLQSNVLDVLVSRLRRRLNDLEAGVNIHPIRGVGYLLTKTRP